MIIRIVEIAVFEDSAREVHVQGSPVYFVIPGTLTDLAYLQHNNAARGDFRRRLTGDLDKLCIRWSDDCADDTLPGGGGSPPIDSIECHLQFFTPNTFTPNGDNLNEQFHPVVDGKFTDYNFQIYNRWGELIFEADHPDIGWDGSISGEPAPTGTYIYKWNASLQAGNCNINKSENGKLALLR